MKDFLNEENKGLDVLIEYLSFRLLMMRQEHGGQNYKYNNNSDDMIDLIDVQENNDKSTSSNFTKIKSNTFVRPKYHELVITPSSKRRSQHIFKLNMGSSTDDIHVCIMCLRAIMNNKYGFNMVIQHREAIKNITLSIVHRSLRTKALVLELLAAICLVKGGHEIILSAFDNFKEVYSEPKRFATLMDYFMNYEIFNIDFMVACMQFVNIVVHSVEDMNYRVHLQYEFTSLNLDNYLEKLRLTESEELQVQISAYLDNVFDIASLMEDGETKTTALERVQELEDSLSRALDRSAEVESDFIFKLSELESEIASIKANRDELKEIIESQKSDISTLRSAVKDHSLSKNENNANNTNKSNCETEVALSSKQHIPSDIDKINIPPAPPMPFASINNDNQSILSNKGISTMQYNIEENKETKSIPAPPPPNIPKAPAFIIPPIAGLMTAPDGAMTIKRKLQTKYKLPTLNWVALKPNQVSYRIVGESFKLVRIRL